MANMSNSQTTLKTQYDPESIDNTENGNDISLADFVWL